MIGRIIHESEQTFGKGEDVFFLLQYLFLREATSNLRKVGKLYFQCESSPIETALANAFEEFEHRVIEGDNDSRLGVDVFQKSLFTAHGLTLPIGDDGPWVDATSKIIEDMSCLSEDFYEMRFGYFSEIGTIEGRGILPARNQQEKLF